MAEIRKITLSKVICENCDEVTNVQRAMYVLKSFIILLIRDMRVEFEIVCITVKPYIL